MQNFPRHRTSPFYKAPLCFVKMQSSTKKIPQNVSLQSKRLQLSGHPVLPQPSSPPAQTQTRSHRSGFSAHAPQGNGAPGSRPPAVAVAAGAVAAAAAVAGVAAAKAAEVPALHSTPVAALRPGITSSWRPTDFGATRTSVQSGHGVA